MMVVHTMVMMPWRCTGAADGSEANASYKEHGDYLFHCFSFFGYSIVVTKCEPPNVKSAAGIVKVPPALLHPLLL